MKKEIANPPKKRKKKEASFSVTFKPKTLSKSTKINFIIKSILNSTK